MNKIEVKSKNQIFNEMGKDIEVRILNDTLKISVKSDSDDITLVNNVYPKVEIFVGDNVNVSFTEINNDNKIMNKSYKYEIGEHSKVIINKFYYMDEYNESIVSNLNGIGADFLFNLSTISKANQIYQLKINHNNRKTISNIYNHGVTLDVGALDFTIDANVAKGMTDSVLNQDNKVMTIGAGKSIIRPNLFIEENMVEARHGASIGRFNEEELFYLETRGIPEEVGYKLLLKGFLIGNLKINDDKKQELSEIIEKFGR